jgi:hypothetical protein
MRSDQFRDATNMIETEKQESVAESEEGWNGWLKRNVYFEDGEPLMHSAPEWVGLTNKEIRDIHWSKPMNEYSYARAIEAKLKEKNGF